MADTKHPFFRNSLPTARMFSAPSPCDLLMEDLKLLKWDGVGNANAKILVDLQGGVPKDPTPEWCLLLRVSSSLLVGEQIQNVMQDTYLKTWNNIMGCAGYMLSQATHLTNCIKRGTKERLEEDGTPRPLLLAQKDKFGKYFLMRFDMRAVSETTLECHCKGVLGIMTILNSAFGPYAATSISDQRTAMDMIMKCVILSGGMYRSEHHVLCRATLQLCPGV